MPNTEQREQYTRLNLVIVKSDKDNSKINIEPYNCLRFAMIKDKEILNLWGIVREVFGDDIKITVNGNAAAKEAGFEEDEMIKINRTSILEYCEAISDFPIANKKENISHSDRDINFISSFLRD